MSLDINVAPVIEAALSGGGQLAELFLEHSTGLSIVMDDGQVEKVIGGADQGAGLRLIHQGKTSFSYSNLLDTEGLLPLARNVARVAEAGGQPFGPQPTGAAGWVSAIQIPPQDVETKRKLDMVRAVEAEARKLDPRVRQVRVTYGDRRQMVRIANNLGVDVRDLRCQVVLAVQVVAEDKGLKQTGYEVIGGHQGYELFDEQDPLEAARTAARRAVMMLTAVPAPGGEMPVVLSSSAGGTMIHEAVGHGLEGDLVFEKMSVYAGQIGQTVASPLITVIDDGTIPHKRGSFGYDDEGTPSTRNVLIEKGVLKGYMQDLLSANRLGMTPSGNGRRESYRHRPVPRMTNTLIAPGDDDPAAILSDTPEGLLVVKMGGGQVNTVNGDFVFEVTEGYLIENGRAGAPVRGATLTGNGPQVLAAIDRVGSDLGYGIGTCGKDGQGAPVADAQPTLRIPRLVVGGQHQG